MFAMALVTLLLGREFGEKMSKCDTGGYEKGVKNALFQVRYVSNDACLNSWSKFF